MSESPPPTTIRGEGGTRATPRATSGLVVGTRVGRYVILGVAGQGGFGAVYRAYDPELDRNVAVKTLDGRVKDDPAVRGLVLAEARALAKLRHPNIVTVYDVGEHEGRGFVAMEYVQGQNLAAWLAERPRPWAAIAQRMAKAARGLTAAHDAGIVHRDFKPGNVLVDDAGGVFVADFGLARAVRGDEANAASALRTAGDPQLPPGTPRYLAPELYDGDDAGPRSDVFAYCVTLWEAVYGAPPWHEDDEAALLAAKRRGAPPSPGHAALPNAVRALLRSGLSADPQARPSSPALLATALESRGGRRRWGIAAVAGLAAVAGVATWLRSSDPCDAVAVAVDEVWSPAAREEIHAAITDRQAAHQDETWARLSTNVDAWVGRWKAERTDACRATYVRHEQSPAMLDRRMGCLDRALWQISTLLQLVRQGPAQVVGQAPQAVAKLGAGLACDRASLQGTTEDPTGPEVAQLVADLDRAQVLEAVAQYDEGLVLARDVEQRAEAAHAVGVMLRAKYRRGRLLDLTGDAKTAVSVHEAVHWDAEAERLDDVAANAGLDVMYEYAAVLGEPRVALAWAPHVEAAIRRTGNDVRRRASLIDTTGIAHLYLHDIPAAQAAHEQALALRESYDDEGLDTVVTLQNLGIVYEEVHRYDDAIALQRRALAILMRLVGEHHPHTARAIDNLGTALFRKGELQAATEHFQRALEIRRSVLTPGHRAIAISTVHLAHAALQRGDTTAAIEGFQEGLRLHDAASESASRDAMFCHEGLAHAYRTVGDLPAARRHAALALEGLAPTLPADHPEIVGLREILALEP